MLSPPTKISFHDQTRMRARTHTHTAVLKIFILSYGRKKMVARRDVNEKSRMFRWLPSWPVVFYYFQMFLNESYGLKAFPDSAGTRKHKEHDARRRAYTSPRAATAVPDVGTRCASARNPRRSSPTHILFPLA